jgi:putative peptide zinc metalloprotease protein
MDNRLAVDRADLTPLLRQRPARDPAVVLGPVLLRGPKAVHVVRRAGADRSYEMGVREHFVLSRLDGTRTLAEIGQEYAAHFGRVLGERGWGQLLGLLGSRQLLAGSARPAPTPARGTRYAPEPEGPRSIGRMMGTTRFADPTTLLDRAHRAFRWLFTPWLLVPLVIVVVVMEVLLATRLPLLWDQARVLRTNPELIMFDIGLLWVSSGLHELAHGVVARHVGGGASEIGMRWGFAFYCKVEDVLLVSSRWRRCSCCRSPRCGGGCPIPSPGAPSPDCCCSAARGR